MKVRASPPVCKNISSVLFQRLKLNFVVAPRGFCMPVFMCMFDKWVGPSEHRSHTIFSTCYMFRTASSAACVQTSVHFDYAASRCLRGSRFSWHDVDLSLQTSVSGLQCCFCYISTRAECSKAIGESELFIHRLFCSEKCPMTMCCNICTEAPASCSIYNSTVYGQTHCVIAVALEAGGHFVLSLT